MNKQHLRQQYRALRKSLPLPVFRQRCTQLVEQFLQAFDLQPYRYLHLFLPIEKQVELDTFLLIAAIQRRYPDLVLVVPRVIAGTFEMEHFRYEPDKLLVNAWGIPEPNPEVSEAIAVGLLDVVLLPLLVCDEQGNRVGYGKGFYDRFLAQCKPDVLKIGLCLEPPVSHIDDAQPWDVRLDACVTPNATYYFG